MTSQLDLGESYFGIDPGVKGAIVTLGYAAGNTADGKRRMCLLDKMPEDENGIMGFVADNMTNRNGRVLIERIVPGFAGTDKVSMCKLYGNYCTLRAFVLAAGISLAAKLATDWHDLMGIEPMRKSESDKDFKNRLKGVAQYVATKMDYCVIKTRQRWGSNHIEVQTRLGERAERYYMECGAKGITLRECDAFLLAECARRFPWMFGGGG